MPHDLSEKRKKLVLFEGKQTINVKEAGDLRRKISLGS